uniref:Uncharacterized protein n=1 Tax=Caenorhabditis japonica TaxID=281687 RepID=A0A8R1IIW4_CAEJA
MRNKKKKNEKNITFKSHVHRICVLNQWPIDNCRRPKWLFRATSDIPFHSKIFWRTRSKPLFDLTCGSLVEVSLEDLIATAR